MRCDLCGFELESGVRFCQNCGQEFSMNGSCSVSIQKSKKNLTFASIATVLVYMLAIIGVAVFWSYVNPGEYPNLVLYNKDGNVYMTNFDLTRATKVNALIKSQNTRISQDGSRFFYMDESDNTLMYVELPSQRKGGVVDEDVREFKISKTGDIVYYLKGSTQERKLYKSDLKSAKLIAEGAVDFVISPDGSNLLCTTENEVFYYKNDTLAFSSSYDSNHSLLYDINLDNVYFITDRKLCTYKDEKVVEVYDGVKEMVTCLQDGRLYFCNTFNSLCYYDLQEVKVLNLFYSSILHADTKEPIVVVKNNDKVTVVYEGTTSTNPYADIPEKAKVCDRKIYVLCWDRNLYVRDLELKSWESYDTSVVDFGLTAKGDVVALKYDQRGSVVLYINKKKIIERVDKNTIFSDIDGNVIYQTLGDEKALYIKTEEETKKITDNFESFFYYNKNKIYFIKRTQGSSYTDLYLYDGEYESIVDDKVYSLIAVREEKYGHYEEEQSENHGLNLYSVF